MLDCDVLQADGGTRTASITGAYVALPTPSAGSATGICWPASRCADSVAAVSVGVVGDTPMLDLCYTEDSGAEVDMNIVMSGDGRFIEVQGTAEERAVRPGRCSTSCSSWAPLGCRRLHRAAAAALAS